MLDSGDPPTPCKAMMGTEREGNVEFPLCRVAGTSQVPVGPL